MQALLQAHNEKLRVLTKERQTILQNQAMWTGNVGYRGAAFVVGAQAEKVLKEQPTIRQKYNAVRSCVPPTISVPAHTTCKPLLWGAHHRCPSVPSCPLHTSRPLLIQVDALDRSGHPEDRRARRIAVAHQLQQDYAAAEALVEALKDVSGRGSLGEPWRGNV